MPIKSELQAIETQRAPTAAEQVFDSLYQRIVTLELAPGTKLSEVEVATQLGVSRQPVREAFFRLSHLGFLLIRPQRATVVRQISETDVLQAMYIRAALETAVVRTAAETLGTQELEVLTNLLEKQKQAVLSGDNMLFHTLDDAFHKTICEAAGVGFVWNLIKEKKAHMDRVRYLTISFAAGTAVSEHKAIIDAIRSKDSYEAEEQMRGHLSRIKTDLPRIRQENRQYFV